MIFILKFPCFKNAYCINRIYVQLDGNEYSIDQHGATIPVDVFQSTTVRELRAAVSKIYIISMLIS